MSLRTKEREVGVWEVKEKTRNLQIDEKEQIFVKQILAGLPRNNGMPEWS